MEIRDTLAVADHKAIYTIGQQIPLPEIDNLEQLLWAIAKTRFTHIWVTTGALLDKIESSLESAAEWDVYVAYRNQKKKERPTFLRAWRKDKIGGILYIGFSVHANYPWSGCESVRTLLATISYIENELGLPLEWGAGHMGLELLKKMNQGNRYTWLAESTIDLEEKIGKRELDASCSQVHWKRELTAGEREKIWLHKIDKNSMYMAACTSLSIGEGTPVETDWSGFKVKQPGVWLVDCSQRNSLYDGIHLPAPIRQWMSTDLVNCARELGYSIVVKKGWTWPSDEKQHNRYHRTLASTADKLWKSRIHLREKRKAIQSPGAESLRQALTNAYESISTIMHRLPGKLGDSDTSQKKLYRRDIWQGIESAAIANLLYDIENLRKEIELTPCLIDVDALWYASDEPEPEKLFPGWIDANKLGRYKHLYKIKITEEITQAFSDPELKPVRLVDRLNRIAEENRENA